MKINTRIFVALVALFLVSTPLYSQSKWNDDDLKKFSKVIKDVWGIFTTFKSIGEFINPGTSMDDIIDEIRRAKEEIINKIDETAAEEQIREAAGYFELYIQWLDNPTQERWEGLITKAPFVKEQLEGLIEDESPYVSYLTCVSYNKVNWPLRSLLKNRGRMFNLA
jgi:hypothetical protein